MIALIQRVSEARVDVDDEVVGRIDAGLLAFVAVEKGDGDAQSRRMLERILGYRVFSDESGRMNRSLRDVGGGLLLVSQFTLAADTSSGMRAGFSGAATPEEGERWFNQLVELARNAHPTVETGRFRTHMKVQLINDGPVTFHLRVAPD
jgi:D-aminoacyl-tRNA deacylase